jgi:hypothetical protein
MYRVPPTGPSWPAVGAPLERRVRPGRTEQRPGRTRKLAQSIGLPGAVGAERHQRGGGLAESPAQRFGRPRTNECRAGGRAPQQDAAAGTNSRGFDGSRPPQCLARPRAWWRFPGETPGASRDEPLAHRFWRGLTFELRGRRRQDARPRAVMMHHVPQVWAWRPAVGAPLERGVRRHCQHRACQRHLAAG